jgi:hypothetical protein
MFDLFYHGQPPGLFAHEQAADSIEHARELSRTRLFWWVNADTDYRQFDFFFVPPPWQAHQRHAWASQWQKDSGTYLIPTQGYTDTNYHAETLIRKPSDANWENLTDDFDTSWHPDYSEPAYIYQFGTQWQPTGGPRYCTPGATEIKYIGFPRAVKRTVDSNWEIPEGVDLQDFDLTWHPDSRDPPYIYQFGTQWQKTGGPRYRTPGASEIKYVEQIKTTMRKQASTAYVIDHLDGHVDTTLRQVAAQITVDKTVRFFDNYLDTLKRIASSATDEFVWITSSICDYSDFDFSWHPEIWQAHMLHVFPSNDQKFGDTFFMHVPSFRDRINQFEILDWYDLNFCTDQTVPRRSWPVVQYSGSSMVPVIEDYNFRTSYALFCHESHRSTPAEHTASVWSKKHRELVSFSAGNSTALVPKDVKQHLETQVYDYPLIKQSSVRLPEQPQDIVFISYDELNADENYQSLKTRFPQARRVHGVEGMVNALVVAAHQSSTDWYYAVFAKTEVHEGFHFDFCPDRFQQPKHYIFHAINVVNDLVYGEMGIILYNRQMVLQGPKHLGIDYTMSFPNETIPIVSAWGRFNTSPYQTWRTAFRETAKLCLFDQQRPSVENTYRLHTWLSRAHGDHAEWALRGAADGKHFFEECQGIEEQMKPMFSWQWLRDRFENTYGKNL